MNKKTLENDLTEILGERVTVSSFERSLYTSDLIAIPELVSGFFKRMPDAVVKPENASEISSILNYCYKNKIPVIPRAGGSSGLLGSVPKKGGIVLDLRNVSQIIDIDSKGETVNVKAGITWWELDKKLRQQGLTVKTYPSSALSATVGGWVMGSGLGIGSLKYGPVFNHIISAEIILADGTIRRYKRGQGLDLFFESEGILGIMTKVKLAIRRIPEDVAHHLIYFNNIDDLFNFVGDISGRTPDPYAIEIFDHHYLNLLRKSGYTVNSTDTEGGMALVTYESEREEIKEGFSVINKTVKESGGKIIEGAEEEWRHRFNMLRVKRAAPTVIPSSVYIPLDKLSLFNRKLDKLKKRPVGLLGHIISRRYCMMMPLLVTDDKKQIEYTLALHTPREFSNLALSLGGKPGGGVGVWNAPFKEEVLSPQKVKDIAKAKSELDPKHLLNPGMMLSPQFIFKPLIYHLAMTVLSYVDKIIKTDAFRSEEQGFEKEIAACVQCGYCMNYCPTKQQWISSTPRGRILSTRQYYPQEITFEYLKSVFQCSLCGRCAVDCSVDIKSPAMWVDLRNELVKKGFELECLKNLAATIESTHNIVAKNNEQRGNWSNRLKLPYDLGNKRTAEVVYFTGCITSFYPMVQDIARSFAQILNAANIDFGLLGGEEWCCGYPLISAGHKEDAARTMQHNIEKVVEMGAKSVVMTCPGCYRMWKDEYHNISGNSVPVNVYHSTEYISQLLADNRIKLGELKETITYHDPCDLGRSSGIYDEPRNIIRQIPGLDFVELEDNREYCNCCGSGGDLLASNEKLSLDIAGRKVKEVLETKAQTMVTACPSCSRSITIARNAEKAQFNVVDIAQLVWKAMLK